MSENMYQRINPNLPHFQRRDNTRQLQNFTSVIQPLVDTARSVNVGVQNAMNFMGGAQEQANSNSVVINLDGEPRDEAPLMNNESVNHENVQTVFEAQRFLKGFLKYVPFILILLAKTIYDYHNSIFILVILFVTFVHTNSIMKKETTKRDRRSLGMLFIQLVYISACCVFVQYVFVNDMDIIFNLILVRTFTDTLTMGKLLWIVIITDFGLKLITITLKIMLTMLPAKVVPFKKRGKVYLFIEATSQMYRSIATIQPWLYYLLEAYHGPEKVISVFLSAFYMISKGSDLISRVKLLKASFLKLIHSVTFGTTPSNEEIQIAGGLCPICHDEYDTPILLECRHIFCENCVTTWFDREQTCPLCRAKIVDDPSWRDGSTSYFIQLY